MYTIIEDNYNSEKRGYYPTDLSNVQREDSAVFEAIMAEKNRQNANIELIASENFVTEADEKVLLALPRPAAL